MTNTKHPLIGKKIVDQITAPDQVTMGQLKTTLGDVVCLSIYSAPILDLKGWVLHTDQDVIQKVVKT